MGQDEVLVLLATHLREERNQDAQAFCETLTANGEKFAETFYANQRAFVQTKEANRQAFATALNINQRTYTQARQVNHIALSQALAELARSVQGGELDTAQTIASRRRIKEQHREINDQALAECKEANDKALLQLKQGNQRAWTEFQRASQEAILLFNKSEEEWTIDMMEKSQKRRDLARSALAGLQGIKRDSL